MTDTSYGLYRWAVQLPGDTNDRTLEAVRDSQRPEDTEWSISGPRDSLKLIFDRDSSALLQHVLREKFSTPSQGEMGRLRRELANSIAASLSQAKPRSQVTSKTEESDFFEVVSWALIDVPDGSSATALKDRADGASQGSRSRVIDPFKTFFISLDDASSVALRKMVLQHTTELEGLRDLLIHNLQEFLIESGVS